MRGSISALNAHHDHQYDNYARAVRQHLSAARLAVNANAVSMDHIDQYDNNNHARPNNYHQYDDHAWTVRRFLPVELEHQREEMDTRIEDLHDWL